MPGGNELGYGLGEAINAGLGEWHSSLARKFAQQQAQAAIDEARRRDALQQQIALVRADAQTRAADTSAGARRYAADAGYSGRTEAANTNAESRGYVADTNAKSRNYAADTSAGARRYGADQGLKGANVRAGATVSAAKIGAGGRVDAANIGAGASQNRSLMSLFGTMNHPRVLGQTEKGASIQSPPPPKFSEWMGQQGLPDIKPTGAVPAAGAPAASVVSRPKVGGKPVAAMTHAPEHLQAAAELTQQIKDAQARGDTKAVSALVQKGSQFLSSLPELDQQDDEDDDPDDDEDDDGS